MFDPLSFAEEESRERQVEKMIDGPEDTKCEGLMRHASIVALAGHRVVLR